MNEKNPAEAGPKTLAGGLTADATRPDRQLPPLPHPMTLDPIYEATIRGFGLGWDARQPEVDRLNAECDRLWLRQWEPRTRERIVRARMDRHFESEWDRFIHGKGRR